MDAHSMPVYSVPRAFTEDLARQNPWWTGQPIQPLPPFRRWPFNHLLTRLRRPIAPILVIRAPRQIGRTTLQLQLIETLLAEGVSPSRILRVQFDELPSLSEIKAENEPILRTADGFERTVLKEHFLDVPANNSPVGLLVTRDFGYTSPDPRIGCVPIQAMLLVR